MHGWGHVWLQGMNASGMPVCAWRMCCWGHVWGMCVAVWFVTNILFLRPFIRCIFTLLVFVLLLQSIGVIKEPMPGLTLVYLNKVKTFLSKNSMKSIKLVSLTYIFHLSIPYFPSLYSIFAISLFQNEQHPVCIQGTC